MQQTKQNGIDTDCSGRMTRSHGLKSRRRCHPITQQKTEGRLVKADTIEELGEKFGLTHLAETVAKYNEYCEKGVDEQFGANKWYLSPIKEGPFYAVQCEPSAWSTFGGVRTDDCCRALDLDNQPIEGLYASGNTCGMRFGPEYITPIPGVSIGMCLTLGRELGKYLAAK